MLKSPLFPHFPRRRCFTACMKGVANWACSPWFCSLFTSSIFHLPKSNNIYNNSIIIINYHILMLFLTFEPKKLYLFKIKLQITFVSTKLKAINSANKNII